MNEVSFECPGCSQPVAVCTSMSGQLADCPSCQTEIIIPHFQFEEPEVAPKTATAPIPQTPPVAQVPPTIELKKPTQAPKPSLVQPPAPTKKTATTPMTTPVSKNVKKPAPTKKLKQVSVERRPVQKPKTSIMKPVAILGIASVAIAGAVNYGLTKAEKVKSEQVSKIQRQKAMEKAEEAIALQEKKVRTEWNALLALYKPALRDESKAQSVIEKLEAFKLKHPNSQFTVTADMHLSKLIRSQVAREKTKNKILENKKVLTMNKLIAQAQAFINKREYIKAYNIFAEYNGPLAEEIKPLCKEQMEYLSKLANGQKITKEEFLNKKQQNFYRALAKSIVKSKSSAPLKKFDTPEIRKERPELGELIDNYKKNSTNLATYFKRYSGKSTMITISGEKNIVKIIDADTTQVIISQKIDNSELKRKIKYKDLDFKDKANAISKIAPTAGALYGLVGSLRRGDTKSAQRYSKDTGPLADGFMEQL